MKKMTAIALLAGFGFAATAANAGDSQTLIDMDKAWGEATSGATIDPMIAEDILAIGAEGLVSKAAMLKSQEEPATGPYIAGDYQVHFLSDDIAVMVHSSGGDEPHWSMHVWQKKDGKWVVAANASVPAAE